MQKIRIGMIGGGIGAFIGDVHRMAMRLDGMIDLVAGAFSSNADRSRQSGESLGLDPARVYPDYRTMIEAEAALPADQRIHAVSIVTPNHVHFEPAKMAIEHGFHVMCDKPVTFSTDQALELRGLIEKQQCIFGLTHNYTGYPMVKEARAMIASGELGAVRRVMVEYPQGWLATNVEESGQKQASWRTDPSKSGKAGAMGDIGTHAENLAAYVTGLKIVQLCADLHTFVPGRRLDDDGAMLLRYDNGARGVLLATQIAAGEENNLKLRVYGEHKSIEWSQMEPNTLLVRSVEGHLTVKRTGVGELSQAAQQASRIPAGHPEGFLEAFANLYREFATAVQDDLAGARKPMADYDFPQIDQGVEGMQFIDTVVASSEQGSVWVDWPQY
jgi:predicted dehydrogenase